MPYRCDVTGCFEDAVREYDGNPYCQFHLDNCHVCGEPLVGTEDFGFDCQVCSDEEQIRPFLEAQDRERGAKSRPDRTGAQAGFDLPDSLPLALHPPVTVAAAAGPSSSNAPEGASDVPGSSPGHVPPA